MKFSGWLIAELIFMTKNVNKAFFIAILLDEKTIHQIPFAIYNLIDR